MTALQVLPKIRRDAVDRPRRRGSVSATQRRAAWLMVAPAGLHALIWIAVPVVATFVLSVTNYSVLEPLRFVGLGNYVTAFADPVFQASIVHTAVYTFFTVPVAMAIAVFLAVLLNLQIQARSWYRAAYFLPQVTATVAVAMVWLQIYDPQNGLANKVLALLGITGPAWLADPGFALPSVIVVGIWQGIGIKMLIYLAALQNIPADLYEAAALDGANGWQRFRRITLPMLRPATFFRRRRLGDQRLSGLRPGVRADRGRTRQRHHDDDVRGVQKRLRQLPNGIGLREIGGVVRVPLRADAAQPHTHRRPR
ncbi:carbohydrate ABC transporter permease [Fodinicola feengrottensis]|uniref:carbohydrate ABC transporter permease n=1 Tax=Fodinicola feengrottensis TaxID=435914 RepID=UPI002442B6F3|nr:sugar ABC transporter permease [Fodinicola feengrottensis]